MKKLIFIAFLFLILCPLSFGQNSTCPKVVVTGHSSVVRPGETMTFTANIEETDIDLDKLTYQWSVDNGTIIEGQGTPTITISTEKLFDTMIKATLGIEGLSENCTKSFSENGIVALGGSPLIIDEFGKLPRNDEKARLDVLVMELNKKSEYVFVAYIILYHPANKKSYEKKVARIKNFLIKDNKIPAERVVIVPGGNEPEERVRIYLIPAGSLPPTP